MISDTSSKKTTDLVDAYDAAMRNMEAKKEQYEKAREYFEQAKYELAHFIVPADAKNSETFQIWLRRRTILGQESDALLCVTTPSTRADNQFTVFWRE